MRILHYQRNEKSKKGFLPWQRAQRELAVVLKMAASQYLFLLKSSSVDDLPQQQFLLGPEYEAAALNWTDGKCNKDRLSRDYMWVNYVT